MENIPKTFGQEVTENKSEARSEGRLEGRSKARPEARSEGKSEDESENRSKSRLENRSDKQEDIGFRQSGREQRECNHSQSQFRDDACMYAFKHVYNDILKMVLRDQNIAYTARDDSYGRNKDESIHTQLFCDEAEMRGEIRGRQIGKEIGLRIGTQCGIKEGEYNKLKSIVLKKRLRGYAVEEIADMLEEDIETIESIIQELEKR